MGRKPVMAGRKIVIAGRGKEAKKNEKKRTQQNLGSLQIAIASSPHRSRTRGLSRPRIIPRRNRVDRQQQQRRDPRRSRSIRQSTTHSRTPLAPC